MAQPATVVRRAEPGETLWPVCIEQIFVKTIGQLACLSTDSPEFRYQAYFKK